MPAILFDLDGVFYIGNQMIPGAQDTIAWVQEQKIPHCFLTNTTSCSRMDLVNKLKGFGIHSHASQILTPPIAAVRWITDHVNGYVVPFVPDSTRLEFETLPLADEENHKKIGAVVVGDLGKAWDFERLNSAFRILMRDEKPVLIALGMTKYWKAPDGLRLDVAPFISALEHATGRAAVVLGKPAQDFYDVALSMVHSRAEETIMVGDDIRGDVVAAHAAGIRGILVRTGKFRPSDLEGEIVPDAVLSSIADLPGWWREQYVLSVNGDGR